MNAPVTVLEPRFGSALPDPAQAVASALRNPTGSAPLRTIAADAVRARTVGANGTAVRVGIVFNDITRATPNSVIIPPILGELAAAGVDAADVTLYNATGTHRKNTSAELDAVLGDELARELRIVQNDALDAGSHRYIGTTSRGNRIEILSDFLDCDIRILTGFIEPHFFAGFSGGGKAIMPGLASMSSIMFNHRPVNIDSVDATWGMTAGNPIFEDVREAAGLAGNLFLVNVTLDREKRITGVFAGGIIDAHEHGIEAVRREAMVPVDEPFDIVITSNSGYPLDLNLYQCVKGMSAAARITRPGGAIILAAECWDGLPDHGSYARLLRESHSPGELLARIRGPSFLEPDMWQAQIHALIAETAAVYVHTAGLTPQQLEDAMVLPCVDIAATVSELMERRKSAGSGGTPTIAVLPDGPLTVAYVTSRSIKN